MPFLKIIYSLLKSMCCLITCYSISVKLVQGDCRGRDRMVVGFTTTFPIIAYHY